MQRLLLTPMRVFRAGLAEKADIYHFHDPELVPYGLLLRALGKNVIYDVHEYYKMKLLSKTQIPGGLRHFVAWAFDAFESMAAPLFSGIIVVDRDTERKFKGRATTVRNYADKSFIAPRTNKKDESVFKCVYVGGLEGDRGLFKMIEAMEYVDGRVRLIIAGFMFGQNLEKAEKTKGFERVDYLGVIPWQKVMELLPECNLGLVLLQPTPAYLYAGENTVKLFEYMMAGMPVLVSNFPNMAKIIEDERCGATVDPTDPKEIAKKIMYFADNPEVARQAGENGRKAIMEKYNWEVEEKKLLGLYSRILKEDLRVSERKETA